MPRTLHPFLRKPLTDDSLLRIFCLPYAGGGASRYFRWRKYLPREVEVCPILLPGREDRLQEPAFIDLQTLVYALAEALLPELGRPFALFGHSMGALISFELARCLRRELNLGPLHLFASGYRAPQLPDRDAHIHSLPDAQFCERLRDTGEAPDETVGNREYMALMLPALRADFALCETYEYYPEAPLDCPISALGGLDDPKIGIEELSAWQVQTTESLVVRRFAGGHLFLNRSKVDVIRSILEDLDDTITRRF